MKKQPTVMNTSPMYLSITGEVLCQEPSSWLTDSETFQNVEVSKFIVEISFFSHMFINHLNQQYVGQSVCMFFYLFTT